jgi:formyltetrahydrofolate deformylase
MNNSNAFYSLVISCPDRKGIVAAVASHLAVHDASIVESSQFNDPATNRFYMRTVFRQDGPAFPPLELLSEGFAPVARDFAMDWHLHDTRIKPRLLVAVSKFGHCLYDLLHRWRSGQLAVEIPAIVSNHDDMRSFVEWNGIPFHYLPVGSGKEEQEAAFLKLVSDHKIDLVVLARYMQVLSPKMCEALAGRCINIHHSFLPSFKGSHPYQQAYARGVKIIGATAHYVTPNLDEGPIIEQDVQRVTHAHTPEDFIGFGRDVECRVLARAVAWHVQRRVMIAGAKTVVFA